MPEEQFKTRDLDPFIIVPPFRWAKNLKTWWLLAPLTIGLVGFYLCVTVIDGTFGSSRDFQAGEDFERVFDIGHPPASIPYFPWMRDITSWFLLFMIIATCLIVHKQWRLIAGCMSGLARNGVLKQRQQRDFDEKIKERNARILRIDKLLEGCKPPKAPDPLPEIWALDSLIARLSDRSVRRLASLAPVVALFTALLVFSLIVAEQHGLFEVFMPSGLSQPGRNVWLSMAYANWWASDHHPLGFFAYILGAYFIWYVILMQNIVGLLTAYMLTCLPSIVVFDADWLNRDGRYGWRPLSKVIYTVYASLTLHGFAISVVLVVLGVQNFPWMIVAVIIWVVGTTSYVFLPWIIFGRVETQAQEDRIRHLETLAERLDPDNEIDRLQPIVTEIERVRNSHIRPVQIVIPGISAIIFAVLLPIVLTIVQIVFAVRFGGK